MLDYDVVIEKAEKYEPYAKAVSTVTVGSSDFLTILKLLRQQKQMIDILNGVQLEKSCSYYIVNRQKPCCTHDCFGCTWYV